VRAVFCSVTSATSFTDDAYYILHSVHTAPVGLLHDASDKCTEFLRGNVSIKACVIGAVF
jgi:hypothetical protein